jgi:hypothetical protein
LGANFADMFKKNPTKVIIDKIQKGYKCVPVFTAHHMKRDVFRIMVVIRLG